MGEALRDAEKAKGAAREGWNQTPSSSTTAFIAPPTLSEIGITRDQSSRYQQIAAIPRFGVAEMANGVGFGLLLPNVVDGWVEIAPVFGKFGSRIFRKTLRPFGGGIYMDIHSLRDLLLRRARQPHRVSLRALLFLLFLDRPRQPFRHGGRRDTKCRGNVLLPLIAKRIEPLAVSWFGSTLTASGQATLTCTLPMP